MLAKMGLDSDETNNVRKFNTKTLKNRNHTGVLVVAFIMRGVLGCLNKS